MGLKQRCGKETMSSNGLVSYSLSRIEKKDPPFLKVSLASIVEFRQVRENTL